MSYERTLFIGGPWDGVIRSVEQGLQRVRVVGEIDAARQEIPTYEYQVYPMVGSVNVAGLVGRQHPLITVMDFYVEQKGKKR